MIRVLPGRARGAELCGQPFFRQTAARRVVQKTDTGAQRFMKAQGREGDWTELKADDDASYDRVIDIDLGAVEPMAACPHSPGNVKRVKELGDLKVDQVCIGSCTNSSYKDLVTVAKIIKGKKAHPRVSFGVAPGSRQILQMLAREGYLADFLDIAAHA